LRLRPGRDAFENRFVSDLMPTSAVVAYRNNEAASSPVMNKLTVQKHPKSEKLFVCRTCECAFADWRNIPRRMFKKAFVYQLLMEKMEKFSRLGNNLVC